MAVSNVNNVRNDEVLRIHAEASQSRNPVPPRESESRIRDTDMAEEMVSYVKNQILQQTSLAMLAQANMKPIGILDLLR